MCSVIRVTAAATIILTTAGQTLAGQTPAAPPARLITAQLGGGILLGPKYEGSDEWSVHPLPLASLDIGGKVFVAGGVAGVYLAREKGFTGSLGVTLQPSRSASSADALAGMSHRGVGAASVSSIRYQGRSFEAAVTGTRRMGKHGGYTARAEAGVWFAPLSRMRIGLGVNLTLADRDNMTYDFGVSHSEAQRRSGLIEQGDRRLRPGEERAYRPDGGLRSTGVGTTLAVPVTRRWGMVAVIEVSRLGAGPAASPLVRRRNSVSGGLGVVFTP